MYYTAINVTHIPFYAVSSATISVCNDHILYMSQMVDLNYILDKLALILIWLMKKKNNVIR
jgi:hypothetical protein